jgi:hypothetical protein
MGLALGVHLDRTKQFSDSRSLPHGRESAAGTKVPAVFFRTRAAAHARRRPSV